MKEKGEKMEPVKCATCESEMTAEDEYSICEKCFYELCFTCVKDDHSFCKMCNRILCKNCAQWIQSNEYIMCSDCAREIGVFNNTLTKQEIRDCANAWGESSLDEEDK